MGSNAEFVNTLEDVIRKRGAVDKLTSDRDQPQISKHVHDILLHLQIDDWQSEPHFQHQNFAEHGWKFPRRNTLWMMDNRNVDNYCWFPCMTWVADAMNRTCE